MWAPGWNVGSTPSIGASSKAATPAAVSHLRRTCTRSAACRPDGASGTSARCSGTCWSTGTIGSGAGSRAASASILATSPFSSVAWCRSTAICSLAAGVSARTALITLRPESTGCTKNTAVDAEPSSVSVVAAVSATEYSSAQSTDIATDSESSRPDGRKRWACRCRTASSAEAWTGRLRSPNGVPASSTSTVGGSPTGDSPDQISP